MPLWRGRRTEHLALLVALVASCCATAWILGLGFIASLGRPADVGDWVLALAGIAVLAGLVTATSSMLRGPRAIVHGPSTDDWSLRARPVPFRVADSRMLTPGSPGFVLARQVVRAAASTQSDDAGTARAIDLLVRIVDLSRRSSPSTPVVSDVEWARLRVEAVNFAVSPPATPPSTSRTPALHPGR